MANPLSLLNPWEVVKGFEYARDQNQQDIKFQKALEQQAQQDAVNAQRLQLSQQQLADYNAGADVRAAKRELDLNNYSMPIQQQAIDRQLASFQLANPGVSTIEALERISTDNTNPQLVTLYKFRLNSEYTKAAQAAATAGNLMLAEQFNRKAGRAGLGFSQGQVPLNASVLVDDNGIPNTVPGETLMDAQGRPVSQRQYIEAQGGKAPGYVVAQDAASNAIARTNLIEKSRRDIAAQNNATRAYVAELQAKGRGSRESQAVVDMFTEQMDSIDKRVADNQKAWEIATRNGLPTEHFLTQYTRLTEESRDLYSKAKAARLAKENADRQQALGVAAQQGMAAAQGLPPSVQEAIVLPRGEVVTPEVVGRMPLNIVPAAAAPLPATNQTLVVAPPAPVNPVAAAETLGLALDAARTAHQAALTKLRTYGSATRQRDPSGYDLAQREAAETLKRMNEAEQRYRQGVAGTVGAFVGGVR